MTEPIGVRTLRADRVLTPSEVLAPGWLTLADGRIAALGDGEPPERDHLVDLGDRIVAPGFVDLHVHGGGGAEVGGSSVATVETAVRRMAAHHAAHGTTSLLATTVAASHHDLRETLRGIGHSMSATTSTPGPSGARVLGAHLEGPWIAVDRHGAHDPQYLRPPSVTELDDLLAAAPGVLRVVTLAPELPGGLDLIAALARTGVVASIGHTGADLAVTTLAIEAGARHTTHLFNAMPGLHHRDPGPVGAALSDPRVTVELIADDVHVHPLVLQLVMTLAPGRVVAVTDAIAATGMPGGTASVGGRPVVVSGHRVSLVDAPQTLAGSVLTMDRAVANLVRAGASLPVALAAATSTPARVLGRPDLGALRVGVPADLVVLNPDLTCASTIIGGRVVSDTASLFAADDVP